MPFTDTYANSILNYTFSKVERLSAPEAVYIGLCTNDPEASGGTITELSGGGYHRVMVAQRDETYPNVIGSASGRMIQNTRQINWTKATADWAEAKGFFLSSSSTVGEKTGIFFYGKLEEPVSCTAGAVALFDPNTLKISFPKTDTTE
jgi:hypothetical protein